MDGGMHRRHPRRERRVIRTWLRLLYERADARATCQAVYLLPWPKEVIVLVRKCLRIPREFAKAFFGERDFYYCAVGFNCPVQFQSTTTHDDDDDRGRATDDAPPPPAAAAAAGP